MSKNKFNNYAVAKVLLDDLLDHLKKQISYPENQYLQATIEKIEKRTLQQFKKLLQIYSDEYVVLHKEEAKYET